MVKSLRYFTEPRKRTRRRASLLPCHAIKNVPTVSCLHPQCRMEKSFGLRGENVSMVDREPEELT